MKRVPTFRQDNVLLGGTEAIEAWKAQEPVCNCGSVGEAGEAISGSASNMPAKWLGCPNCSGQALGRPLVYRLPSQMA